MFIGTHLHYDRIVLGGTSVARAHSASPSDRRLITFRYAVYSKTGVWEPLAGDGRGCPLLIMDTGFGGMTDVGWIKETLPHAHIAARSNSREIQAQLCALGAGLAVLPRPLGAATVGISEIDLGRAPPSRENWMGYHRDLKRLPRLRALADLTIERLSAQVQ